ncbi:MAG: hypothetical protein ABL986_10095 [Vicinamibacterales bacterium]
MSNLGRRSACAFGVLLTCASLDGATLTRQHADAFERKVQQINSPKRPGTPARRTPVSEDELNSWFAYRAQPVLPEGITNPQVTITGAGRLTAQATVDLEAVGRRRSTGGWLDPFSLLGGRVPLTATGTLQTRDGVGRFSLESATLGGLPVPKIVLQELLSLYTRSDDKPRGASLDDPFPLPADIRQLEVGRGEAVVVQ